MSVFAMQPIPPIDLSLLGDPEFLPPEKRVISNTVRYYQAKTRPSTRGTEEEKRPELSPRGNKLRRRSSVTNTISTSPPAIIKGLTGEFKITGTSFSDAPTAISPPRIRSAAPCSRTHRLESLNPQQESTVINGRWIHSYPRSLIIPPRRNSKKKVEVEPQKKEFSPYLERRQLADSITGPKDESLKNFVEDFVIAKAPQITYSSEPISIYELGHPLHPIFIRTDIDALRNKPQIADVPSKVDSRNTKWIPKMKTVSNQKNNRNANLHNIKSSPVADSSELVLSPKSKQENNFFKYVANNGAFSMWNNNDKFDEDEDVWRNGIPDEEPVVTPRRIKVTVTPKKRSVR
jgi:hypothetical protein